MLALAIAIPVVAFGIGFAYSLTKAETKRIAHNHMVDNLLGNEQMRQAMIAYFNKGE